MVQHVAMDMCCFERLHQDFDNFFFSTDSTENSIIQSIKAVCANIKRKRYYHFSSNYYFQVNPSTPMGKGCMDIMFDMVDTAFSY